MPISSPISELLKFRQWKHYCLATLLIKKFQLKMSALYRNHIFLWNSRQNSMPMSCFFCLFVHSNVKSTEAQRYHCKYNCTTASFILLPRVLSYCRETYFSTASFILLPRVLFYCREFYFTAASFIIPPRVLFCRREFYFHHREFYFTASGENKLAVVKIKLAAAK